MTNLEKIIDKNIDSYEEIITPRKLMDELPLDEETENFIIKTRSEITDILDRKDKRKIIIVGPCSIHNTDEALEYAKKLKTIALDVEKEVLIVMRVYLEKPRTILGWKGLLYDPDLDNTNNVEKGLRIGRKLLLDINKLGIGTANEFVRTDFPQYIADLISWTAIGARSVEYTGSRELASGLSMPVGFKNNTSGDIEVAVNACKASMNSHTFTGMDLDGRIIKVISRGNPYSHVVLRGGNGQPNYHPEKVDETISLMKKANIAPNIIIDCSHANSNKIYERQEEVSYAVLSQMRNGNSNIIGIMLESNLCSGNQPFPKTLEEIGSLNYGVSVTDSCLPFDITERIIRKYAREL